MARTPYDPVKAKAYYERTKVLKGRKKGSGDAKSGSSGQKKSQGKSSSGNSGSGAAKERVVRLKATVAKLEKSLSEAKAALSKQRASSRKTAKKSSDGKTTAKERQSSKEYRDKNKEKLKSKRKESPKAKASSSSKSSGSSKSSSTSVSDMGVEDLQARIRKIESTLREAKRQLSAANQKLGSMAHNAIASQPDVNEHFARFQSDERIPSK